MRDARLDDYPLPSAIVDLREVKAEARRLLPPGHAFREAILREPDTLPRNDVTTGKMLAYLRLLYATRNSPAT